MVKNFGGDSWVGEVADDLRANSANGGITVDVARATVHAKTANGDIRGGELGSGAVDLYTATGELEAGQHPHAQPGQALYLLTVSDALRRKLAAGSSCQLK